MDTQMTLPTTFEKFAYSFLGEKVTVTLNNNQLMIGTLLNVRPDFVQIFGNYLGRIVYNMSEIFSITVHGKKEKNIEFFHSVDNRLYKKFNSFLNRNIEIRRENNCKNRIEGKLLYLGRDYFVVANEYERWIACVLLTDDTVVKIV